MLNWSLASNILKPKWNKRFLVFLAVLSFFSLARAEKSYTLGMIAKSQGNPFFEAARVGALSLEKLEAWTSVCSVGIDMVAVPGSTSAETIAAIIADEMAIGVMNNKTTAVRIIPVPGREVGEMVEFGGLLGSAPIMPVNVFSSAKFIRRGGRIPAPIHSLRN